MVNWESNTAISDNLLPAHAYFPEEVFPLDGKWRFSCLRPEEPLPDGWNEPDFNDKNWGRITVPYDEQHPQLPAGDIPSGKWTALFRRSFILSGERGANRIILRFRKLRLRSAVWVNGIYIGVSAPCSVDGEFDITHALRPDKNFVCIQSFGEDPVHSGKPQPVLPCPDLCSRIELYPLPDRAITDVSARSCFHEDGTPLVHVYVRTCGAEGLSARVAVMDDSRVLGYMECPITDGSADAIIPCPDAALWCADNPRLYRIAVILWDGTSVLHKRQCHFGLRQVAVRNSTLLINGLAEKLFAADYDPNYFTGTNPGAAEQALNALKQHHFNAIRLNGEASAELLRLCDRIGIYVLAPVASADALNHNWNAERSAAVFGSHPCLVAWDLDDRHPQILPMKRFTADPDRIASEDMTLLAAADPHNEDRLTALCADIRSGAGRCGIVIGNIQDYFAPSGLPTPLLRAVGHLICPIKCTYSDGILQIHNHSTCLSAKDLNCRYVLTRDGEETMSGTLRGDIAPGTHAAFPIETKYDIYKPGRYYLNVEFLRQDGSLFTMEQWPLASLRHIYDENPGGTIREEAGTIMLRSGDSTYAIDRAAGNLKQLMAEGKTILAAPCSPIFREHTGSGFRIPDEWEKITDGRKKPRPSVLEVDHMTRTVSASYRLGSGLIQTCRLYSDGSMAVELRLRTGKTAPDKLGILFPLDVSMDCFRWFGLGPEDALPGRTAGQFFSTHEQTSLRPDSTGRKEPVYHFSVTNSEGYGVQIRSDDGLGVSVRKGRDCSELRLELPAAELKPHSTYFLNFTVQLLCGK